MPVFSFPSEPGPAEAPSDSPTPVTSPEARAQAKESNLGGLVVLGFVLVVLLGAGGAIGLYLTRDTSGL